MRTTKWLVVGWLEHYYFNKSYGVRGTFGCEPRSIRSSDHLKHLEVDTSARVQLSAQHSLALPGRPFCYTARDSGTPCSIATRPSPTVGRDIEIFRRSCS